MSHSTGGGTVKFFCDACKKPWCKHRVACRSCGNHGFMYTPPVRGYATPNYQWICLWCNTIVCIWCYWSHTADCPRRPA